MYKLITVLILLLNFAFSESTEIKTTAVLCKEEYCPNKYNEVAIFQPCDQINITLITSQITSCVRENQCFNNPVYYFELKQENDEYQFSATNTQSSMFYYIDYQCKNNKLIKFSEKTIFRNYLNDSYDICEKKYDNLKEIPKIINFNLLEDRAKYLCR